MRLLLRALFFRWLALPSTEDELRMEILVLRRQLQVFQKREPRPNLGSRFRLYWLVVSRLWPRWKSACLLVKPETVIRWHRTGFRLFWMWKSRKRPGRKPIRADLAALIRRMAEENHWGAPRIHGELLKLGFKVSETTVWSYMSKTRPDGTERQRQNWRTFLANHRDVIAAMDFLVVPTWNFRLLTVLVILKHGRRELVHFNVTSHPSCEWVKQQIREAFPFDEGPRYLIFDRDTIFGPIKAFLESMGISPKQTAFRSPWQNGACERMIGSIRRDLLDHVIVFNEDHLRRLLRDYAAYYHVDRTHLGLGKDSPRGRPVESKPDEASTVMTQPRLGGLHHRYTWDRAA
jgi:transposase InsO family protein